MPSDGLWSRLPESAVLSILDYMQPTVDDFLRLQHASPALREIAWPCARELLLGTLGQSSGTGAGPQPFAHSLGMDSSCSEDARAPALAVLGRLGWLTADRRALDAAARHVCEDDPHVRLAAAAALVRIAGPHRGSGQALAVLWPCLGHGNGAVRSSALAALGGIAERGNAGVVDAACAALQDELPAVRVAALGVLRRVAPVGAGEVLQGVAACLEHGAKVVREEAADVLAAIAGPEGSRAAVAAVVARLGRATAVRALTGLAVRGGPEVCAHAVGSLCGALTGLAVRGGPEVCAHAVGSLCGALWKEECSADAKCMLLDALAEVVAAVKPLDLLEQASDSCALAAITACLAAKEERVRWAAAAALGRHASAGSRAPVAALCERLQQASRQARQRSTLHCKRGVSGVAAAVAAHNLAEAAVVAFRSVVEAGDADSLVAVTACLQEECCEVRVAAMKAVLELTVQGDPAIQRLFLEQLTSMDAKMRHAAVAAFGHLLALEGYEGGPACDAGAVGVTVMLAAVVQDPVPEVRREAASVLALLAERGRAPELRRAAARALAAGGAGGAVGPQPPACWGPWRRGCVGAGACPSLPVAQQRGRVRGQRRGRGEGVGWRAAGGRPTRFML